MPDARLVWGKTVDPTEDYSPKKTWLPALDHMVDTGKIAEMLWDGWMSEPMKDAISGPLSRDDARRVFAFVSAIHDFGKITPGFVARRSTTVAAARNLALQDAGFTLDGTETKRPRHEHLTMALLSRKLMDLGWSKRDALAFSSIPGSHHGHTPDEKEAQRAYKMTHGADLGLGSKEWEQAQDDVWAEITRRFPLPDPVSFDDVTAFALVGAIVLADWASSTFGWMNDGEPYREDRALSIWRGIWSTRVKDDNGKTRLVGFERGERKDRWRPSLAGGIDAIAAERFPVDGGTFSLRESQRAVVEAVSAMTSPGIMVMEAPPGDGKTEGALLSAEILASHFGSSGFVFSLPTMATTSKMWRRVLRWSETAKLPAGSTAYLGFSQSLLDDQYDALLSGASDLDVKVSSFFTRRMGMYSDISVTTVDKVLPVALKHKYLFTSHLAHSDKVVIIDEVHSYDAYMSTYLNRTLEYLGARGVPVILLSATLTKGSRRALIERYAGNPVGDIPEGYPLVTTYSPSDGLSSRTFSPLVSGRDVHIDFMDDDLDSLVERVVSLTERGANVMVVRTTVNRAQEAYAAIRARVDDVILLHSRFTGGDRGRLEGILDEKYGKDSQDRPRGGVVVSTQVIEQSLDLDFDAAFSDPAPIDLLIQRLGRTWRHERPERPIPFPTLTITGVSGTSAEPKTYSSLIYHPATITGTLIALREEGDVLSLPSRISPLIEKVYDPIIGGDGVNDALIRRLHAQMEQSIEKERISAQDFVLSAPGKVGAMDRNFGPLVGRNLKDEAARSVRNIDSGVEGVILVRKDGGLHYFDRDPESSAIVLAPVPENPNAEDARRIARFRVRLPDLRDFRGANRARIEADLTRNVPDSWTDPGLRSLSVIPLSDDLTFEVDGHGFRYSDTEGVVPVGGSDHDDF